MDKILLKNKSYSKLTLGNCLSVTYVGTEGPLRRFQGTCVRIERKATGVSRVSLAQVYPRLIFSFFTNNPRILSIKSVPTSRRAHPRLRPSFYLLRSVTISGWLRGLRRYFAKIIVLLYTWVRIPLPTARR